MALRVCMVTPFAWSQPHPVNEHVAGAAGELRRRGHEVVVLAPSNRAADLAAGRRALRRLARDGTPLPDLVALGPAVPVSGRSLVGVPLGVRANLSLALSADRFDVVHAHEPGLPSLSYLALRRARGLTVATFHSPERLGYPPSKRQREKLLARVDALTATSDQALEAARARFPGDFRRLPLGIDETLFSPDGAGQRLVLEWRGGERPRATAALKALAGLPGWELAILRTRPLAARPYVPRSLRPRVRALKGLDADSRAEALRGAGAFVPAHSGSRVAVEAAPAGVPVVDPPGADAQPELVTAALARLAEDDAWRAKAAEQGRRAAAPESLARLGDGARARRLRAGRRAAPPAARRGSARRPAADRVRPPHAHGALARLLRSGRATCSTTPRNRGWARSRSPTTTSSPARRRRSSSRRAAT